MVVKRIACSKRNDKRTMMTKSLRVLSYWKLEMIVLPRMLTEKQMKSLRLEKNWK